MLRPATAADLRAVERLLVAADLPTAGVAEVLATRPDDFVVADDPGHPGEVAAVGGLEVFGDGAAPAAALLRSVAVHPAWRGHGLGQAIVHRLIARGEARGLRALYLLTTTAERWFPRFGFAAVARDAVPPAVAASVEFRSACPASATAMARPSGPRTPQAPDAAAARASVAVRPAVAADLPAVAAIYNAGIRARGATFETRERVPDELAEWLGSPHPFLVAAATRDGAVLDWVRSSAYRPRACYAGIGDFSVYVAPEARGRGVGDALLAAFLPACAAAGLWKLVARIFPENAASRALCARPTASARSARTSGTRGSTASGATW